MADTGVAEAGVMGTAAEGNRDGWYVDWLVNMLGHCGIPVISGCSGGGCVVLGAGWRCCGGCMLVAYMGSMGSGA